MGTHAVVVGAGLAGLCAARALAEAFDRVTVLERDAFPHAAEDRAGVPQSRHVHALLARGSNELEGLFPGFRAQMLADGALDVDVGLEFAILRPWGWSPRRSFGMRSLFASRRLIERTVRERLRAVPHVEIRERAVVTGLAATATSASLRVIGVQCAGGVTLECDFVLDASGRQGKALERLAVLGIRAPDETIVDARAGYSTRWYDAPPPELWPREWWWRGIWIDPEPPHMLRAGVLFPVEDGRWMVTLAGLGGDYPPTDEAGFDAFVSSLRSPLLAEATRLGKPISGVGGNRAMANRLRHLDRWHGPEGFAITGDSACSFNPVYGQGMTTAAIVAGALRRALRDTGPRHPDLARRFLRLQAAEYAAPWAMATGADLTLPGTEGARPFLVSMTGRYMERLFMLAMKDEAVLQRIVEVMQMLRPASALVAPSLIARVGFAALKGKPVFPEPPPFPTAG